MVRFEKDKLVIEMKTSEPVWLWVELMKSLFLCYAAVMEADEVDPPTKRAVQELSYHLGEALANIQDEDHKKFEKAVKP